MAEKFYFPQEKMSFVRRGFKASFAKQLMVIMDNREKSCFAMGLE